MSKGRKYPRIGQIYTGRTLEEDSIPCAQCGSEIRRGAPCAHVDIQWDWFRGDDDVVTVCKLCAKGPLALSRLIKAAKAQDDSE